jgi:hypothetical protein
MNSSFGQLRACKNGLTLWRAWGKSPTQISSLLYEELTERHMQTRLTMKPGQKGTKALQMEFGARLMCVRYKYDAQRRKRYKTVELIVEERDWMPRGAIVEVDIERTEREIQNRVKAAGGRWDSTKRVWILPFTEVVRLGLAKRVLRQRPSP